jgi:aerobic-type carbon monoxide dehydrogenase small subunit (CoxS/CutS family)
LRFALLVNGQEYRLDADSRTTLLDALREQIGLTGTKKGSNAAPARCILMAAAPSLV